MPKSLLLAVALLLGTALAAHAEQSAPKQISRTENIDGSAAYNLSYALPTQWEAKVGADFSCIGDNPYVPGTREAGSGAAWARLKLPSSLLPLWEKGALDARVDPLAQERTLATTFGRAVPLAHGVTLKIENRYGVTQSAAPGASSGESVSSGGAVSLVLPTETTFSAGTTLASGAASTATLSAAQKLFGGVEFNAAVSGGDDGSLDRRFGASFKRQF
jgi:hypothetical protein